jgi:inorganic pyrophosphatase
MPEATMRHQAVRLPLLSEIPPFDEEGTLRAIIETPRGSRNKYDYDPENNAFELNKVLPEGMSFPYDFGFVPSTLADDGDPLDVLVLMDAPAMPGCVVTVRLLGAIEARQKEKDANWARNDRLVAVAEKSRVYAGMKSLDDLGPHDVADVKAFFAQYNELLGKKVEYLKDVGPREAEHLVEAAQKKLRKKNAG